MMFLPFTSYGNLLKPSHRQVELFPSPLFIAILHNSRADGNAGSCLFLVLDLLMDVFELDS